MNEKRHDVQVYKSDHDELDSNREKLLKINKQHKITLLNVLQQCMLIQPM